MNTATTPEDHPLKESPANTALSSVTNIITDNINGNKTEMFIPSKEQSLALARLLTPEIKKFFADERTQKEFNEWKEKQNNYIA